jgi:stage II sporulation protein D
MEFKVKYPMTISDRISSKLRTTTRGMLLLAAIFFTMVAVDGCRRVVTIPTPQMDTARSSWVRIRLDGGLTSCTIGVPDSSSVMMDEQLIPGIKLPRNFKPFTVTLAPGGMSINGILVQGQRITITPGSPFVFDFNGKKYRGNITLTIGTDGRSFEVVNEVPLEAYLAGVIGSEMPYYWEPEALKAQAIAARTYCLDTKMRIGINRAWDVSPTQAHQVYSGISAENAQIWAIVNATRGKVLVCTGQDGQESVFPTYYSSTCGGHTEDGSNIFGESWSALKGVACPYCRDIAPAEKYQWPTASYDLAEASRLVFEKYPTLKNLGEIRSIVPSKESKYDGWSRIIYVRLTGTSGQTGVLKAQDLRLALDPSGTKIKSTACVIQVDGRTLRFIGGKGWGHGVGMCQCGAQGMARKGFTVEQILGYYYPGAAIRVNY